MAAKKKKQNFYDTHFTYEEAEHEWSNVFVMEWYNLPPGRKGHAKEKIQFIYKLLDYRKNGKQFSLSQLGRLLKYTNGDHSTISKHASKRNK